jgi:hypothetical protein
MDGVGIMVEEQAGDDLLTETDGNDHGRVLGAGWLHVCTPSLLFGAFLKAYILQRCRETTKLLSLENHWVFCLGFHLAAY